MGGTIVSEPVKSNRPLGGSQTVSETDVPASIARWSETGLDGCALLLPPLLALVPHGAAPLAAFAGLCAAALVAATPPYRLVALRLPAAILGGLLVWAAASVAWSIDPGRSLALDSRLAGLFVAALALAAAA